MSCAATMRHPKRKKRMSCAIEHSSPQLGWPRGEMVAGVLGSPIGETLAVCMSLDMRQKQLGSPRGEILAGVLGSPIGEMLAVCMSLDMRQKQLGSPRGEILAGVLGSPIGEMLAGGNVPMTTRPLKRSSYVDRAASTWRAHLGTRSMLLAAAA
jgi:uncharacterized membrane protein YeaQ/YmgE (transglycosylase-associated protein family)